ncbi:hypothetical protein ACKWTF_006975 [Chironomus riparius]
MTELNLKTKLTPAEKFIVVFGITLFGICASMLIGKNLPIQVLLSALILYLITGRRPTIVYASVMKCRRDFTGATRFSKMLITLKLWEMSNESVPSLFRKQAATRKNKNAFLIDDKTITFQEIEDFSNKIGRCFQDMGFEKGDTISLLMENRLEFIPTWLGLSKIRVITALINTNLRKEALIHCIRVAQSKAIIVSSELADAIKEIYTDEDISKLKVYVYDENGIVPLDSMYVNLYQKLETVSAETLEIVEGSCKDKLIYIYTSGTTGLPKAVNITHIKYMYFVCTTNKILGYGESDCIYTSLPLYHSAGGIVGTGNTVLFGVTVALRKKFSASNFWTDCKKYNCTAAQYIGELCRYLLMTPKKPSDTDHKLKFMIGNGLRPEIWTQFVERFKIPTIVEIYGATESNANFGNFDNTVGAIGFTPQALAWLLAVELIKYDEVTYEPLRDANGFCIRCSYGEPGILIGKIRVNNAVQSFSGYSDKKASEKKIFKDVFKTGDMFFNSGDILVMDVYGYFYFKDRVGDTFRWKGENVSTTEVEGAIVRAAKLSDCVVYGVNIPGADGKAGMATIADADHKVDLDNLANELKESLPAYARPIFIRLGTNLDITGTFKLRKVDLQRDGFDITKINDAIYLMQRDGSYKRMTVDDYQLIQQGGLRL